MVPMRLQTNLRGIFALFALVAAFLCVYRFVQSCIGPVFPPAVTAKLQPGISTSEVERLLGPPTQRPSEHVWVYQRALNPGWLGVTFDENGRLLGIDNEIPFP
jgi:hypothetical protein